MKTPPYPHIEPLEARIAPALTATTFTWEGDAGAGWDDTTGANGSNKNWLTSPLSGQGTPGDGRNLVFPDAASSKTNTNDITGLDVNKLTFTGTGYNVTGMPITLAAGFTANYATAATNTFLPKITLAADQTFAFTGNAGATFNFGEIDLGGKTLTFDNTFKVKLAVNGENFTGAGALIKNGTGELDFSLGSDFSGLAQVNAGTLVVPVTTSLGAVGPGNGTTVASGGTVRITAVSSAINEDFTLAGLGAAGQTGAVVLDSDAGNLFNLAGGVRLSGDATMAEPAGGLARLGLLGAVGAADDALATLTVTLSKLSFANTTVFTAELAGGGEHDQLNVNGEIDLGGAALNIVPSFTPSVGDKFTILLNDGTDPITGTFAGLAEGATFAAGGVNFKISYKGTNGSTGNDVVLTVDSLVETPLPVTLSANGKTATFVDRDGDNVTITTNKGPFQQNDFRLVAAGVAGGGQLQLINFTAHAADFIGANLTVSARPGPLGGNGFVNVGYVNATGIDLGAVKIAGDLGRIAAGTPDSAVFVPAMKSLTVESIGALGTSTQSGGGDLRSDVRGSLSSFTVKEDFRSAEFQVLGSDAKLGAVTIGGSVVADSATARLGGNLGIDSLKIGGDLRAAGGRVEISAFGGALGAVTVGGGIHGTSAFPVVLSAFGQKPEPAAGVDLALKSLTVKGSVQFFRIELGTSSAGGNADASAGSITVAGDWISSRLLAGVSRGQDSLPGTTDDTVVVSSPPERNNPDRFSNIGSFTVRGQALGTPAVTNDMFAVEAERIGKAKIGTRTFAFTTGAAPEAFYAAPTSPGAGAGSPVFDFILRELGAATPAVALGGANLQISADGKTATFTDVDGDAVKVVRTAGTFVTGNFTFKPAASGGGDLAQLVLTLAPNNVPFNVTITARPGAGGGNGFVNIDSIDASGVALGTVSLAGDLNSFGGGSSVNGKPGVAALVVHSLGALGSSAAFGSVSNFSGGLGRLTVAADVLGASLTAGGTDAKIGAITIGGAYTSNGGSVAGVSVEGGLGSLRTGGSVVGLTIDAGRGALGALTIGGDFVGDGSNPTLLAFGQLSAPARGLDFALKSLTVKGSVEGVRIHLGANSLNSNADASLGTISVGRAWLGSSVLVGGNDGADNFIGTSDDTKANGTTSNRDEGRFSTISSIIIKGQALGSAAANDAFGIVAEQITRAKIGARIFALNPGERDVLDNLAAAPTGPGPVGGSLVSDFFLRELTS